MKLANLTFFLITHKRIIDDIKLQVAKHKAVKL